LAQALFDRLCEAGWPHSLVETSRRSYASTGEPLGACLAMLYRELKEPVRVMADNCPPTIFIGEVPSWALDQFSREGRAVYARFLGTDAASAKWLRQHITPSQRVRFLGHVVFRIEGSNVDFRVCWGLADRLRREADIGTSGPECPDASEILALVRDDIPRLNEVRAEVLKATRHDR
jgi:hypothetical protein